MKTFSSLLLVLLLAVALPASATPDEVPVGAVLRDVPMQGLLNPSRKLSAYRGKPLVINVWASWCPPCRQEMGSLQRLAWRFGGKFNVIGISTDDYVDRAKDFLQKTNTTFNNYIDSKLVLEHMLGADRLPLTLLVDGQGRVLGKYYGAKDWDGPEALELIGKSFRLKL